MNQKEFLQSVDDLLEHMSIAELRDCLHQLARKTDENKRDSFIQLIEDCSYAESDSAHEKDRYKRLMSDKKVTDRMADIMDKIVKIAEGELCLSARGYEDYSGGYWSSDWVWEYEDHMGVGETIMDAVFFAHDCMNDCRYQEAVEIFDLIMKITVYAEDEDGGDIVELSFEEMVDEHLIGVNLNVFALDVLYSNYQNHPVSQRASVLFSYFSYPYFQNIKIEDIFAVGREELKDTDIFLQAWIEYLMHQDGEIAARMLSEAILYHKGHEGLPAMARIGYKEHPSIYLSALLEYEKIHDYEKMKEIGLEALEKIEKDLVIRGEIAIKTAQAAHCAGDYKTMKECWYEAFYSDSSVANFLRLFRDREVALEYKDLAEKRIAELQTTDQRYYHVAYEVKKNVLAEFDYKHLCFFAGYIEKIHSWCKAKKNPLGWSSHFIGYGIDLLLLFLYADKQLKKAGKRILERVAKRLDFDASKNLVFMKENAVFASDISTQDYENVFWEVFCSWKMNYVIPKDIANTYVYWLDSVIEKRIVAIVGGKYRNKYSDVALLAATLGEVKESMGIEMAKNLITKKYIDMYPRHNAFRRALKEYMD